MKKPKFLGVLDGFIVVLVVVALYALASNALADSPSSSYEFPRNIECASLEEVSDRLENKYKEKLIFTGTSMNKSNSASPTMFITVNSQTNTYTFVNYFKDQNLACIIDSGKMKLHTKEQKRQTL